jgi:hypothetical protein
MPERRKVDIDAIFAEGNSIDEAIDRAVRDAVRRHKLLGNPTAVWEDAQVRWIQPEEIVLPDEPQTNPPQE